MPGRFLTDLNSVVAFVVKVTRKFQHIDAVESKRNLRDRETCHELSKRGAQVEEQLPIQVSSRRTT